MSAVARQAPLFGDPVGWQTAIYRKRFVFALICAEQKRFRADFMGWLSANYEVFLRFEAEADRIWSAGRRRYSQRTIWEYMRHETNVRQAEEDFKLNDHYVKDCALLYTLLHPDRDGFFEFRYTLSAVRVSA